jgi:hypothetical protein
MPVEFGDLPPDARGGAGRGIPRAWEKEAAALRANPDRWARIASKNSISAAGTLSMNIRTGHLISFRPAGDFEVTTRGLDVWVRYVGDGADAS